MPLECINPDDLPVPETYTQVVVATESKLVFISGQEPEDMNGKLNSRQGGEDLRLGDGQHLGIALANFAWESQIASAPLAHFTGMGAGPTQTNRSSTLVARDRHQATRDTSRGSAPLNRAPQTASAACVSVAQAT